MRSVPRAGIALAGGVGAILLAGGVASAVVRGHTDRPAALPALCRDNPGSAGGALPSGKALQQALGSSGAGSTGSPAVSSLASTGKLGSGSAMDLQLRARALTGGTADSAAAPLPAAGAGQGSQAEAQGDSGGTGGGSGGPGGAGSGGRSGSDTGPLGGSGNAPLAGQGPDSVGNPQQPQPLVKPPLPPPVTLPKAASRHNSRVAGVVVVLLVLALLAGLGYLLVRSPKREDKPLPDGTGLVPADAEALAARALASGDLDLALRWTFVSGLLRLDEVAVLPYDPTRTTTECAQWVRSVHFPVLAAGFDLVAYGGRHATLADVTAAQQGWIGLLREVTLRTDRARDAAVHGPLASAR